LKNLNENLIIPRFPNYLAQTPLPLIYTRIGSKSALGVEWRGQLLADEDSRVNEGDCGDGGVDDGVDME